MTRKSKTHTLPSGIEVTLPPEALPPIDPVATQAVTNMANKMEETIAEDSKTPTQGPGIQYDGLICNASVEDNMVWGNIYNDRKKRFPDGKHIRTSFIMEFLPENMVRTNNSLYKVEWTQAQLDKFAAAAAK